MGTTKQNDTFSLNKCTKPQCKKQVVLLKKKDGIQLIPPASILLNNQAD